MINKYAWDSKLCSVNDALLDKTRRFNKFIRAYL
jgi:hypothetical protein